VGIAKAVVDQQQGESQVEEPEPAAQKMAKQEPAPV
jgi:hypothetical protein